VWIILAMALGLVLGRAIPSLNTHLNSVQSPRDIATDLHRPPGHDVPGARERCATTSWNRHQGPSTLVSSLVINWVIGPLVMFILAWLMLPTCPRTGPG